MRKGELKAVAELAQAAFWAVVANHYPSTSGDFPPEATMAFNDACEGAVTVWVRGNVPQCDCRYDDTFDRIEHCNLHAAAPFFLTVLERIANESCDHGTQVFAKATIARASTAHNF